MLHAAVAAAGPLGLEVLALHVHHGLSAKADLWLAQGQTLCERWARQGRPVEFVAQVLAGRPVGGESVEAWARQARYRALRRMALDRGADLVLLAHHRRDQAETFLLQALRGGGVEALSAMPSLVCREGVTWARPWLDAPRESIDAYVKQHRLRYIDDESNVDPRFARSLLRARVWPALIEAFPEAETTLAMAARWAQQAAAGLTEWAAIDLPAIDGGEALDIASWRSLSPTRQSNALRVWLRERISRVPASLVERLVAELGQAPVGRWHAPGGELRSYRGRLRYDKAAVKRTTVPMAERAADFSRPGEYEFPEWQGAMVVARVDAGGLPVATAAQLELRSRSGGERFQSGTGRPPRSLKLQYQAAGVPEWQRAGPIAFHGGVPVFVPGLGIDARALAGPGEAQVSLSWQTH